MSGDRKGLALFGVLSIDTSFASVQARSRPSLFLMVVPCYVHPGIAEEPDRVRTLLEDVENVRRSKMYEGMSSAAQEVQQAVKVRRAVDATS